MSDAQVVLDLIAKRVREQFPDVGLVQDAPPEDVCAVVYALLSELRGRQIIGVRA